MELLTKRPPDFLRRYCLTSVTSVSVDMVSEQGTCGGPNPVLLLQSTLTLHTLDYDERQFLYVLRTQNRSPCRAETPGDSPCWHRLNVLEPVAHWVSSTLTTKQACWVFPPTIQNEGSGTLGWGALSQCSHRGRLGFLDCDPLSVLCFPPGRMTWKGCCLRHRWRSFEDIASLSHTSLGRQE